MVPAGREVGLGPTESVATLGAAQVVPQQETFSEQGTQIGGIGLRPAGDVAVSGCLRPGEDVRAAEQGLQSAVDGDLLGEVGPKSKSMMGRAPRLRS